MKINDFNHIQDPALRKILDDYDRLKESETRYKRLVEAAPDITYIYGTKSGAKFWSPQVKAILGITPETLIEDPFAWINSIHPEDRVKVNELLSGLEKVKTFNIEYRIKDIHGKWHWLNDRTVSVQKTNDEYIIEGLAQDITERKKIEQEFKTSEEKFRKAFMTSTDSININRLHDGLYVSINPGFTRITGYTEKDVSGKTSLELNIWKHPEDRNKLVKTLLKEGQYSNLEAIFLTKDGREKRGLMSASLIKLNNVDHIISITRDITDYFNINKELARNQFLLEKSQEIGNIGTWEIDVKTNAVSWTDQVYHIYGIDKRQDISFDKIISFVHPDDRAYVINAWEEALKGKIFDVEHRILVNDQIKWVKQKANINLKDNLVEGRVIGTIQDMTSRKNIEEALLQSENKYRLIVENANDGIEITQDDHIIYSNTRFAQMLGYEQQEMENITFSEIFTDDAKVDLLKRQQERNKGKSLPQQYQTTFEKKDGTIIDVEVNYQIIQYEDKPATFAIIRDITHSKELVNELRKLSTAVEQSPSMIVITDPDGIFEYLNTKFTEVTGFTIDDVKGKTPRILKSGGLPDNIYKELWDTILSGKTWKGEFQNIKKNGESYWENASISPIVNEEGKIIHFVKLAEDITEWKKIEEALKYREEQYRLIVENANDGILISQNDEFIYKNSQFVKMLGYSNEEFEKITFKDIYTEQGLKDLFERHQKRLAGETLPNKYETTFRKRDGSIIYVEVTYQLINYHDSDATFAIIHDITDNKNNEKALKRALDQAKESDHLKSAFLANMSHEIRTPMNGIIGFTNLLKGKKLSEEKREQYLDIIEKSGERLMNIINDLIDISKIEAKQIETTKTNFNLNEIIDFLYEFFLPECISKNLKLEKEMEDQAVYLYTDKDKLEAILINLLKNAIKFTNEGHISFGYVIRDKNITFYVKDTGIGIPDEKQKFIFDRFAQVDNSISKPYEGAGLGLSISSAFVEMIGGELLLDSTLYKGSKFHFTIPYRQKHAAVLGSEAPLAPAVSPKQESRGKLKILIAEDDEFSYQFISILLQEYSDNILYARNGKEAIDICKNNPDLDLILMDVKMPVLDGYQATRHIRKFNQDVIIVAQTAYAFTDDKEKVIEAGCNDYLSKPIHEEDLKALINKLFYQ
jgi:PAS domain S-box-containing protein